MINDSRTVGMLEHRVKTLHADLISHRNRTKRPREVDGANALPL